MPLKRIAEVFGKSPATITRRLDEVRQAGWLRDHPEFAPPPEIWKQIQNRMTCTEVETELLERLGSGLLNRITVLPSAMRGDSPETRPENVERIGRFAAVRLGDWLSEGEHVVGVNWGWSVRHCVASLRPPKPNPDLRFVPLVGNLSLDESDPYFEETIECSSNRLAQIAAAAFGAPRSPRLNTPAYIPRRFHGDPTGLRAIRDFIEGDVSYRRVFGGKKERNKRDPGMIAQMDTLISGLSSLDVSTLPIYRPDLITEQDIGSLQRSGVVGDLGLHLVVDPDHVGEGDGAAGAKLVDEINNLIVGASPEEFVRVADRARNGNGGLGVVVLASGAWKARILLAAIRMGAVNELITDLETAIAMGKLLGVKSLGKAHLPTARP
jgi:DNA-binding transcriptional regulator LsrR (DeoR family)